MKSSSNAESDSDEKRMRELLKSAPTDFLRMQFAAAIENGANAKNEREKNAQKKIAEMIQEEMSARSKSEEKSSREQEREKARKQLEAERNKALENQVVENKDRYKSEACKLATCEHTRMSDMLTDAFDAGDRDQFTAVAEGCERGNVIDGDYMWAECTGGKKFDIYVAGVKHGSVSASKLYSEFKKRKENCREGITLYYPHTWIE